MVCGPGCAPEGRGHRQGEDRSLGPHGLGGRVSQSHVFSTGTGWGNGTLGWCMVAPESPKPGTPPESLLLRRARRLTRVRVLEPRRGSAGDRCPREGEWSGCMVTTPPMCPTRELSSLPPAIGAGEGAVRRRVPHVHSRTPEVTDGGAEAQGTYPGRGPQDGQTQAAPPRGHRTPRSTHPRAPLCSVTWRGRRRPQAAHGPAPRLRGPGPAPPSPHHTPAPASPPLV